MRGIHRFLKSTFVGGLAVLLPLVVLLAIAGWGLSIALKVVTPLFEWLPDKSIGGVSLTVVAAFAGIIACCFGAGIVAETALVRYLWERAERYAMLVPGYALMKSVGANMLGVEGERPVKTVVVRMEVTWQIGFLMETLADGRHVVFIPGVPKAMVGTMHIVAADRVQVLAMSVTAALDTLGRLGVGLRDGLAAEAASA
jgi:uncharacterized membrane protein